MSEVPIKSECNTITRLDLGSGLALLECVAKRIAGALGTVQNEDTTGRGQHERGAEILLTTRNT